MNNMEAPMTRIETTVTVGDDGASATIPLPTPVAPGQHPAVVIIDDGRGTENPAAWLARTYGSVTDETFERPEALPFEERERYHQDRLRRLRQVKLSATSAEKVRQIAARERRSPTKAVERLIGVIASRGRATQWQIP